MKRLTLAIISIIFIWGFISAPHSANALVSDSEIITNCERTQDYLSQVLRPQDLRSRVQRVQYYDYVHQQLDFLAQRLEHNSQPGAKEMRGAVDSLQNQIKQFTKDYEVYDVARDNLAKLEDCSSSIEQFKTQLKEIRLKRELVEKDVQTLKKQLNTVLPAQMQSAYTKLLVTGTKGGL